jgi:hypothetical protein
MWVRPSRTLGPTPRCATDAGQSSRLTVMMWLAHHAFSRANGLPLGPERPGGYGTMCTTSAPARV